MLCQREIRPGEKWIDEHLRPLGLGGSNDDDNRAPVHVACAEAKTHGPDGDIAKVAKAKRVKMASLGIKRDTPKIKSPGFPAKVEKPGKINKSELPMLPRRSLYQ